MTMTFDYIAGKALISWRRGHSYVTPRLTLCLAAALQGAGYVLVTDPKELRK